MATLDLSKAAQSIDLGDPHIVTLGTLGGAPTDTSWSWTSPGNNYVNITGVNMRFDATGHAYQGLATRISIDIGKNNSLAPDISITGAAVRADTLDDGGNSFWGLLSGNDVIYGADAVTAGSGSEFRLFGDGISTLVASSSGGSDAIYTGTARSTILGDVINVVSATQGAGATVFTGGDDVIEGQDTSSVQILIGDAQRVFASSKLIGGDDYISVLSSDDVSTVYGDAYEANGEGNQRATIIGGNDTIRAYVDSQAKLIGDIGIVGSAAIFRGGDDEIKGSGQREYIIGDAQTITGKTTGGDDELYGYGGDDHMIGDVQNGNPDITAGNDSIYGGAGEDTIYGDIQNEEGNYIGGNDRLYGEAGNDSIEGNRGDDFLDGGLGDDVLHGGEGNDTYVVDSYADNVLELADEGYDTVRTYLNDQMLGANVESLLYIGAGDFTGGGNALDNTIQGGTGNDRLIADGSGRDLFVGASGFDLMDFRGLGRVVLNLSNNVHGGAAAGDSFYGMESFLGSNTQADDMTGGSTSISFSGYGGSDILRGSSAEDTLYGGEGNDKLYGGDGDDIFLSGDAGNDVIDGGAGADAVQGGIGNDTYYVDRTADAVSEAAGEGTDRIVSTASYSLQGRYVEILELAGNATISATGSDLNDRLIGNAGRNILNGLAGRDTLTGGDGVDRFVFDQLNLLANLDTITDFNAADDVINIDNAAFVGLSTGTLSADAFRSNTTGQAQDASDRIIYRRDTGDLYFDQDGDGGTYNAIRFAKLDNEETITYRDFLVF